MRVLPWLLCWISGSAFGAGLAPLVVSPDLVRDAPARPAVPSPAVSTPAPQPVGASPAPAASPVAETVVEAPPAAEAVSEPAAPLALGATDVRAERISGTRGIGLFAEGEADVRRDDLRLQAAKGVEPEDALQDFEGALHHGRRLLQTGQAGSRGTLTVCQSSERESSSISRPTIGVPNPPASFSASAACIVPMIPVSGANTPIVAQRTSSRSSPSGNRQW